MIHILNLKMEPKDKHIPVGTTWSMTWNQVFTLCSEASKLEKHSAGEPRLVNARSACRIHQMQNKMLALATVTEKLEPVPFNVKLHVMIQTPAKIHRRSSNPVIN